MRVSHLLLSLVFLSLLGWRLMLIGMFVDGLWYATMAHNMAQGIGSAWRPYFSATCDPVFFGHPPLVIILESVFFRVFGSGFWVEKLYCAVVALGTLALMRYVWRLFFLKKRPDLAALWPIALVVWLLDEDVMLSYSGNMLECTLGLFALGAVAALLRWGASPLGIGLGAVGTVAAFLSKGPVGLFPLAFFGVEWLVERQFFSQKIKATLALVVATAALLAPFFLIEPARSNLLGYWDVQVRAALMGESTLNVAPHRLYVVQRLLETHGVWLGLAVGVGFLGVKKRGFALRDTARTAFFFGVGMGAVALLPIVVSPKQAAHYVVPSLPYFALALGVFWAEVWLFFSKNKKIPRWVRPALLVANALALVWVLSHRGQVRQQDRVVLTDLEAIMQVVPRHSTQAFRSEGHAFDVHGFFQRRYFVALDWGNFDHDFFILEKATRMPAEAQPFFEKIPLTTTRFDVYRRVAPTPPQ
jgi:4-amino-4-deoxy-L-arabinose transferase-like glycosyltransferase